MTVSAVAVSASAVDVDCTAEITFADANWGTASWDEGYTAVTTPVTGNGTYTVSYERGTTITGAPQVLCVDIDGLATAMNAGKDAEGYSDIEDTDIAAKMAFAKAAGVNVTDVKVYQTLGEEKTELAVDQDKIVFGDIEGNGKIRIEVYNPGGGGVTKDNPPIDASAINFDKLEIEFTLDLADSAADDNNAADEPAEEPAASDEGSSDEEPAAEPADEGNTATEANGDTEAPTTADKNTPDTGVEGVAAVAGLAVIAAGAVIVAKKRK